MTNSSIDNGLNEEFGSWQYDVARRCTSQVCTADNLSPMTVLCCNVCGSPTRAQPMRRRSKTWTAYGGRRLTDMMHWRWAVKDKPSFDEVDGKWI